MNSSHEFGLVHAFAFSKQRKEGHVIYYEMCVNAENTLGVYHGAFYFKYKSYYQVNVVENLRQRLINAGFEIDFSHTQEGSILYVIFNKIKIIEKTHTLTKILPAKLRQKQYIWLNNLFKDPGNYFKMRYDILSYFAGIDEPAIFMSLYESFHIIYPTKSAFIEHKKSFMLREDEGFDIFGRASNSDAIAYHNIEKTFLKDFDKVNHYIKAKKLKLAQKEIKKLDTYYLITKKSKIEKSLEENYGLNFNEEEDEQDNPVNVSEEIIDFVSTYQLKMLEKVEPTIKSQETLYQIPAMTKQTSNKQE